MRKITKTHKILKKHNSSKLKLNLDKKMKGGLVKKPKKKSKKKKESVFDYYEDYLTRYYGESFKDEKLNIKPKTFQDYNWGLGVEHEMHLFHISKKSNSLDISESNILFDAQEATCFLTHQPGDENDPGGACCKLLRDTCYNEHPEISKIMPQKPILNKKDLKFLKEVPWELSGRQSRGCEPTTILKRLPILMPEIITGNHRNRTIESITDELLFYEKKFVSLMKKNPYVRQKIKKYGDIRQLPIGTIADVKVPIKPTMHMKKYLFHEGNYKDYLGSYHITITLPTPEKTTNKEFIALHQNFANQFQWIEPLLISSFFSGDPGEILSSDKKIRGSFRIVATGWGNIAGSDLRKMSRGKGVGRYANIESEWREKLKFKDSEKLMRCDARVRIDEPGAVGILSSDVRTFGFDFTDKCKGKECPKVSGAPMKKPNGIELRIFDNFNSKHLKDLLRILVYIAENSRVHKCNKYVYNNKAWQDATKTVMENGWRGTFPSEYIKELRSQLGLKLEISKKCAYDVFTDLMKELFEKNKDGLYPKILFRDNKVYTKPPKLPTINRFSWENRFFKEYGSEIAVFIRQNIPYGQQLTLNNFAKIFYKTYKKDKWERIIEDVLYAMESEPYKLLKLEVHHGRIKSILYKR